MPSTRLIGMVRLGLITSPAVKVILFHASAENNDPTMATPSALRSMIPVKGSMETVPGLRYLRSKGIPEVNNIGGESNTVFPHHNSQHDDNQK